MTDKHILIIAYHFPPLQGSSGLHRTLSLVRYLPLDGWRVSVLTVSPSAYRSIHAENYDLIPDDVRVIRTPCFDTIRDLSVKGRYPGFLALPDSYQSWVATGTARGLWSCKRDRPSVVLSTFPVASAHCIGWAINKVMNIPWVVDFRDPMAQADYPQDVRKRKLLHRLERRFVGAADAVLVTTGGAGDLYRNRYADLSNDLWHVVPNGYEESMFDDIEASKDEKETEEILLLHSGALYRNERDPACLFQALSELKSENFTGIDRIKILFRGSRHAHYFRSMADDFGLASLVEFGDPVPYKKAVSEMLSANALIVLQASNCNQQIPAKVYEYLRADRPILALADPAGDTAKLLASCGITDIAKLDDAMAIKELLKRFLRGDANRTTAAENCDVEKFSRRRIALDVSEILSRTVA